MVWLVGVANHKVLSCGLGPRLLDSPCGELEDMGRQLGGSGGGDSTGGGGETGGGTTVEFMSGEV